MAATVICSPAGGGKTTNFARRIANANKDWRIEVYVPTHALAQEWKALIKQFNPNRGVRVIGGRNHEAADGKPLCSRHQIAAKISQAGQSVYTRLCRSSGGELCNAYIGCKYIDQYEAGSVFIYTHAYLPLDRGMLDARVPDLVVIDEGFSSVCLEKIEFNISMLRHPTLPPSASALCADVATLLQSGGSLYQRIAKARKRGGGLNAALEALRTSAPRPQPSQSDQQVLHTLNTAPNFEPVAKLLEHLGRAFARKKTLQSVDFDAASGQITVHHRRDITRFRPQSSQHSPPKIYLLDATASKEVTEVFFPRAAFHEIRVRRKAHVVQCRSSKCSKRSINPGAHTDPQGKLKAAHRLGEVQQLINELSRDGKKLLVVGPTAITGNPSKNVQALVQVPGHCALGHFSALRGVDIWKDFDAVLVISRNEPPMKAVQDLARAMFYDDPVPLQLVEQWTMEQRGYSLKGKAEGVDVDVHSDKRAQAILEQLRESETLQAIDRLRLIYCKEPKLVVVLSNIPLDIEVDALLTWDELIHGSRLEQAWQAAGDVMPLVDKWLSANHNSLWPTAAAARKDMQRQVQRGQITNRFSIKKMSPFTFKYWAGGQRRASTCLSRTDDPVAVTTALGALLGHPVRVTGPLPGPQQ
jgi:hypothetical protein